MIKCILNNQLIIKNVTSDISRWCSQNLILDNPDYEKKVRLGMYLGKTPKQLILYEINGKDYILPFGAFRQFYKMFKDNPNIEWCLDSHNSTKCDYQSNINLFDYQEIAVQKAIKSKNGILVMPCGAGKTQTALELIARLGLKTLWITHTGDLLKQSKERAMANFDCDKSKYGVISEGSVHIGEYLTFATVQTLCKIDLPKYKNEFDVIVVDECHKAVGTPNKVMMFYKCLNNLNARYKFGLTATPKRGDGLEQSMFMLIGDIIHSVDIDCVKNNVVPVKINFIDTLYKPKTDIGGILNYNGTIDYSKLVEDLINSKERNLFIVSCLRYKSHQVNIILSDRVSHLETLYNMLNCKDKSLLITGNTKKSVRDTAFNDVKNGKVNFLFSTYALAKEGLDIPNLNNAFLVTPKRDYATVVQSCGRVSRKDGKKEFGEVFDFVDDFGFLKNMAKSRKSSYKKAGYIIL